MTSKAIGNERVSHSVNLRKPALSQPTDRERVADRRRRRPCNQVFQELTFSHQKVTSNRLARFRTPIARGPSHAAHHAVRHHACPAMHMGKRLLRASPSRKLMQQTDASGKQPLSQGPASSTSRSWLTNSCCHAIELIGGTSGARGRRARSETSRRTPSHARAQIPAGRQR